jgi:hypothetical protein
MFLGTHLTKQLTLEDEDRFHHATQQIPNLVSLDVLSSSL